MNNIQNSFILYLYITQIMGQWCVFYILFQHVGCGLSLPWCLKNFVFLSECWNLVFRFRSRLLCCLTVTLVAFLTAGWLKCPTVKHIFCSSNISLTTFIHFYFFSSASFLSDPLFKSKENEEGEYKEKDKKDKLKEKRMNLETCEWIIYNSCDVLLVSLRLPISH